MSGPACRSHTAQSCQSCRDRSTVAPTLISPWFTVLRIRESREQQILLNWGEQPYPRIRPCFSVSDRTFQEPPGAAGNSVEKHRETALPTGPRRAGARERLSRHSDRTPALAASGAPWDSSSCWARACCPQQGWACVARSVPAPLCAAWEMPQIKANGVRNHRKCCGDLIFIIPP